MSAAQQIQTPIGPRDIRVIAGTQYGALNPQDRKILVKMGYELRGLREASGILPNGNLVVKVDSKRLYEIEAPARR